MTNICHFEENDDPALDPAMIDVVLLLSGTRTVCVRTPENLGSAIIALMAETHDLYGCDFFPRIVEFMEKLREADRVNDDSN